MEAAWRDSSSNRKISGKEKTAEATDTGDPKEEVRTRSTGFNASPQDYIFQWKDIICVVQIEMKMG